MFAIQRDRMLPVDLQHTSIITRESVHILHAVSIAFSLIFLLFLPRRCWKIRGSSAEATPTWQGLAKMALGTLLSLVLLSYIIGFWISPVDDEMLFIVSIFTSLLAACGLSYLLLLEQQWSPKPSDLATLYLVASILCDTVILTMPSGISYLRVSRPVLVRCSIHGALLILESYTKYPASMFLETSRSPEEVSSVLGKTFFTWINPLLFKGYWNILVDEDMPPLSSDMKPELTRRAILISWDRRGRPEIKISLPLTLLKCMREPLIAAVLPRLFLITFRYAQPILIKQSIIFVTTYSSDEQSTRGCWLIVSAIAIYVGLATSTSIYRQRLNRLKLMTRSALVGLIHEKSMKSPSVTYDNGESTTLMSSDADSLDDISEMLHETWAQVIEVVVGLFLLAKEVGWLWPLPLFLIYLCSYVSRYVARQLQPRQKAWNSATQSRVAATSSMLSSMKAIKMLGFQDHLVNIIQRLRGEELLAASKLRWMMVYYNASANALGIFSPAITLAIFAIITGANGHNLNTETAFTTVAILSMVTHPANMVMTIVPRAIASLAGFGRIQDFLTSPLLHDSRGELPNRALKAPARELGTDYLVEPSPAIVVQQLQIGERQPILEGADFQVAPGTVVMIAGAVGSGKSTLLRALLGEVRPVRGSIKLSSRRIAYCAQRPWLPSGTIKDVVRGFEDQFDEAWYKEVTERCCLSHDFDSLPDGDETQIGSRGLNLSGGQRQRVAIARALYARCDIVLMDDCFSGLDGATENAVFDNLFGASGLLRQFRSTVLLVSNSTQHFKMADHVVILGDGGIKEQGAWQNLKSEAASIEKFNLDTHVKDSNVLSANFDKLGAQLRLKDEAEVDLSRQTGDTALYAYYIHFAGLKNLLFLAGSNASSAFFLTIPQYWLQLWTDAAGASQTFYVCGFLLISTLAWISVNGIMSSELIRVAPISGNRIHLSLLHTVTSAPLFFFSTTDNGAILNRFTQDIQLVDKQLPSAISSLGTQIFKLLMQIILLFVAQKWLAFSLPACMLFVYFVQKIYLRTSRQLRLLELESRAAVFSSFLESVEGLETIRSFGWVRDVIQENLVCVENSQRPEFLLLSLQRWLSIVLDMLVATIATSVVVIAVTYRGRISGGHVGIALNIMLITNTTLLRLVQNWTNLEISLGAVARMKSLEQMTPSEGKGGESIEPPDNWPSEGSLELKDVTASYHAGATALRNINLKIGAGQKIIVCGRTGSGKSTLLLTLVRLLELQSGTIKVDGVDISGVRLQALREKCFITVSQDPLLLSNETLRFNLDPDNSLSDEVIISALTRCGLWAHYFDSNADVANPNTGEHPILDQKMSKLQELSVGQCQLFSLCRALVKVKTTQCARVKSVILLDEVTSSLDIVTESTIHSLINDEFTEKGHTVIMIAHRLSVLTEHSKPGRDVVVVMGDGRIEKVITDINPEIFRALE